MEVVSYRLRVRVTVPKYEPRQEQTGTPRPAEVALKGTRRVHFCSRAQDNERSVDARIYERDLLDVGVTIIGPAIVEQFDATTVIPSGWSGRVDGYRNLILERS